MRPGLLQVARDAPRDGSGRTGAGAAVSSDVHTLAIENMKCGNCMRSVERALLALPEVETARAHLAAKRVTIITRPGSVHTDTLVDTLAKAGFRAAEIGDVSAGADKEDRRFLAYIGVAAFAAMNIMLLSVSVWAGEKGEMERSIASLFHWVSAAIALPTVAFSGQPFFRSALSAIRARRLNMDVPISLGVILASAMSLFQTFKGSNQIYFDAAVTLLLFLLVGRYLDSRMRARAAGAASNLLSMRAITATVLRDGGRPERLPARALLAGDHFLVAAGERIAADGKVVSGTSDLDQSLISGETAPVRAAPGSQVFAGTVNLGQPLEIEATATDDGTLLAEIGRLMMAAEQSRGRYVRIADRAAAIYAPAVHILGAATFVGWMLAGQGWEAALIAAIAVLIITCPCALALAVPAVQVAASSRLFSGGILVKAADGLERLSDVDTVVLDKTGTLTVGEPRLVDAAAYPADILAAAAACATASRHPYSRAVVAAATERGIAVTAASGVEETLGDVQGDEAGGIAVTAASGGEETPGAGRKRPTALGEERLGSASWVGAAPEAGDGAALWYRAPGSTAPVVFRFQDRLRPDAIEVVARLERAGFAVELLSGDRKENVAAAAADTGSAVWRGEQLPGDKIARIEELRRAGAKVLMVGDGLNDAPSLAAAHASLAPTSAADISQTTADAVFQGENLAAVVETLKVARASTEMARQNFAIAIGYNMVFVPLAVAGLVTPLIAAIAMSASSIAVTANAIRLRTRHLELSR